MSEICRRLPAGISMMRTPEALSSFRQTISVMVASPTKPLLGEIVGRKAMVPSDIRTGFFRPSIVVGDNVRAIITSSAGHSGCGIRTVLGLGFNSWAQVPGGAANALRCRHHNRHSASGNVGGTC